MLNGATRIGGTGPGYILLSMPDELGDQVAASAGGIERPVHVLVVAYGDPDALARCLGGLDHRYPTTVVDNSSSTHARAVAAEAGAGYLDPGENLGFAAAVNLGLADLDLSRLDVLLLNPDAVIGPGAVELLERELAASAELCCVAPAQRQPGSPIASPVCWPFPTPLAAWRQALGLSRFDRHWDFVIASVLLVRGTALVALGGFDEGFFLYAEETDWERRATRAGWRIGFSPDAEALHEGAATDDDNHRRLVRSHAGLERYIRKWHGPWGWRSYQVAATLTAARRALFAKRGHRERLWFLARTYAVGPRRTARRMGVLPERSHRVPRFEHPGTGGDPQR
jgi:GT2 family glycosyltransferase